MIASALTLSLTVSVAATTAVAVVGIGLARFLARRSFRGRGLVVALLSLPLVLPPTVTGYYLIAVLGRQGLLGSPLYRLTGWSIPFTWSACVIAAAVVSFPLMLRAALVAFEQLDPRQELAAASLGHGRWSTFLRVVLPLARRGVLTGVVLSFARGLGEFGATLMLAGNIPGRTRTLPLAIYDAVMAGDDAIAGVLALVLTAVSIAVMLAAGALSRRAA